MENNMLNICIGQGYVPSGCKMDGMLVWLLIKDGKNPCDGCHANCVHRRCSDCVEEKYIRKELEHISKEELQHRERIKRRSALGTNSEPIIYVDTDYNDAQITVIDPNAERGYVTHCKNGCDEAASYITIMCNKYKAKQVIVVANGWGIGIYDCLKMRNLKDIDIVPIRCMSARLG